MVKRFSYIGTFDDHETFSIDATGSEHGIMIDKVQLPYGLKIKDISARLHHQTYLTESEFTFLLFKIGMEVGKKVAITNEVRKQIIEEDTQEGPFKVWVEKCPNEDAVVIQ